MYLSAERLAVANQAVRETFEQSSIAWQAIPHWETGDPGQFRVRSDSADPQQVGDDGVFPPLGGGSVPLEAESVRFALRVAQAIAPTPDALLDAVIARTVRLADLVDRKVISKLLANSKGNAATPKSIADLLDAFIDARAGLEKSGYRAPCCLLTDTEGLKALNQLDNGLSELQTVLAAANINSLYRFDEFAGDKQKAKVLLLGRRQLIAQGGAAAASPGEEPIDLAVSVPPSLEVVGETDNGNIEMAVRIRFAPRLTDESGVVGVVIT